MVGALAIRYLSEEWGEAALRVMETDPDIARVTKGLNLSLLVIILNGPPGAYGFIYAAFDRDGLKDYRVGADYTHVTDGIDGPTFVVSGDYNVFVEIQRGRLTERKALLRGKMHLTGSLVKALRHMHALETITRSMRTIECET